MVVDRKWERVLSVWRSPRSWLTFHSFLKCNGILWRRHALDYTSTGSGIILPRSQWKTKYQLSKFIFHSPRGIQILILGNATFQFLGLRFNRALWSLRFTSLRERELDPTMLGEPYLVIPFYYVEIVWVRLSVWLEMPTSWYPDFKNVFWTGRKTKALWANFHF